MEFALVGSLLMALLLGAIEIGRYLFTLEALRTAAAEAARKVTVLGSANMNAGNDPCKGLSGDLAVPSRAPFLNPGTLKVRITACVPNGDITTVTITVEHDFSFIVPFFGTGVSSISETAQAVFN